MFSLMSRFLTSLFAHFGIGPMKRASSDDTDLDGPSKRRVDGIARDRGAGTLGDTLPPLTRAAVVCGLREAVGVLTHVTDLVSAYLDCSSGWSFEDACRSGTASLVERVLARLRAEERRGAVTTNAVYEQWRFSQGLEMAVLVNKANMPEVLRCLSRSFRGCVVPPMIVTVLVTQGKRAALDWLVANHEPQVNVSRQEALTALSCGHFGIAERLLLVMAEEYPRYWLDRTFASVIYSQAGANSVKDALHKARRSMATWPSCVSTAYEIQGIINTAVMTNNCKALRVLLDNDTVHNAHFNWDAALKFAATQGRLECMRVMANVLDSSSSICRRDASFSRELIRDTISHAISGGHLEVAKYLYNRYQVFPSFVVIDDVVANGHVNLIDWIDGHRPGAVRRYGGVEFCSSYAIDTAVMNGYYQTLKWVRRNSEYEYSVSAGALDLAIANGFLKTVMWVHGVAKWGKCSAQAADIAAKAGHISCLRWLLENGYRASAHAIDGAAANGHLDIVKWLFYKRCAYTFEALDGALSFGHFEVARFLYAKGLRRCALEAVQAAIRTDDLKMLKWMWAMGLLGDAGLDTPWQFTSANSLETIQWTSKRGEISCSMETIADFAREGDLATIKWLFEHYRCMCSTDVLFAAVHSGSLSVVQWFYHQFHHTDFWANGLLHTALVEGHWHIAFFLMTEAKLKDSLLARNPLACAARRNSETAWIAKRYPRQLETLFGVLLQTQN